MTELSPTAVSTARFHPPSGSKVPGSAGPTHRYAKLITSRCAWRRRALPERRHAGKKRRRNARETAAMTAMGVAEETACREETLETRRRNAGETPTAPVPSEPATASAVTPTNSRIASCSSTASAYMRGHTEIAEYPAA